mmetsp:Transcript_51250/g.143306  ORF Transcript_51250/g.143306 Transcript_51250/m.143306 type:complete len:302 (+) Transcript_51250:357-1262(+)
MAQRRPHRQRPAGPEAGGAEKAPGSGLVAPTSAVALMLRLATGEEAPTGAAQVAKVPIGVGSAKDGIAGPAARGAAREEAVGVARTRRTAVVRPAAQRTAVAARRGGIALGRPLCCATTGAAAAPAAAARRDLREGSRFRTAGLLPRGAMAGSATSRWIPAIQRRKSGRRPRKPRPPPWRLCPDLSVLLLRKRRMFPMPPAAAPTTARRARSLWPERLPAHAAALLRTRARTRTRTRTRRRRRRPMPMPMVLPSLRTTRMWRRRSSPTSLARRGSRRPARRLHRGQSLQTRTKARLWTTNA